jgi:hypothetical protein
VAYDYLVLVTDNNTSINSIGDLNGKNFLEVPGSSQRLAWNTMDNMKIDYRIVELVKSPYNAKRIVHKNKELFTFLNNSFSYGSDILKEDTKHLITLVLCNNENNLLKDFVDYITNDGQETIENQGFIKI